MNFFNYVPLIKIMEIFDAIDLGIYLDVAYIIKRSNNEIKRLKIQNVFNLAYLYLNLFHAR